MIILWGLTYLLAAFYLSQQVFKSSYVSVGLPFAVSVVLFVALYRWGMSISHIIQIYFIVSLILAGCLIPYGWYYRFELRRGLHNHWPFVLFSACLFAYQWLYQGAYLELPADVYGVHLFRIGDLLNAGEYATYSKGFLSSTLFYPYIIHAALIRYAPYELLIALNESSAVLTLLLTTTIYSTVFFFTRHSLTSALAVLISCLTWGVDLYSFYRYYTFAPTFFCMMLVFDSVAIVWLYFQRLSIHVWSALFRFGSVLLLFLVASFFSHKQETLFLGIVFCFASLFFCLSQLKEKTLTWWTGMHGGLVILIVPIVAVIAPKNLPDLSNPIFYDWGQWFNIRWVSANLLNQADLNIISLSQWILVIYSVIGLSLFKIIQRKRYDYFYWFSWLPLLLISFPPTATLFAFFLGDRIYYRLFYMSSLFGTAAVFMTYGYKRLFPFSRAVTKPMGVICLLMMPILYFSMRTDFNGRGLHFFKKMEPVHHHEQWQPVYDYLKTQPKHTGKILTDWITAYPLLITSGFYSPYCNGSVGRCTFLQPEWRLTLGNIKQYDYLVLNLDSEYSPSAFEKHWDSRLFVSHSRNTSQYYPAETLKQVVLLEAQHKIEQVFQWKHVRIYRVLNHVNEGI